MPCTTTKTNMTGRTARAASNQENSLAAFLAKKAEFDALLADLQQASDDHFGADGPSGTACLAAAPRRNPAPWRTSRTPYLKDVMDALWAVHPVRRVAFMKGAQMGATESGNCWLGYIMHHVPAPVLAVQPTVELAKRFSRQRIDPLLEETPALRERVAPARARDSGNTMLSKEFPGAILVLTGANSAAGLRSMTARFLFLDEVDAYPGDIAGEGDPIALAEARARAFGWRRKAFLVSTPTHAAAAGLGCSTRPSSGWWCSTRRR
jgi:phage terminase large subunit GpA-like protein